MTDEWQDRLRAIQEACGSSALEIWVVDPELHLDDLIERGIEGDARADQVARAFLDMLALIRRAGRNNAPCTGCSRPLRAGKFFTVVGVPPRVAADIDPLVMALCRKCSPNPEAARLQATAVLQRLYPEITDVGTAGKGGGLH